MSLDYLNPNKENNFKALGMYIFGGSASIGVMKAGFHLDEILEMTEDMTDYNAHHFSKNFDNIPIIKPSEWNNKEYLENLKNQDYDLLYSNCPCSSLSSLNRSASVDGKNNVRFYEVFDAIQTIKPKTFFIENSERALKTGWPIIKDMIYKLNNDYVFTLIRTCAGNHNVAMRRMRTLLVGFRKDIVNSQIPLLRMNLQPKTTCFDTIGDLSNYPVNDSKINNHTLIQNDLWSPIENLYHLFPENATTMESMITQLNEIEPLIKNLNVYKEVIKNRDKLANGQKLWDKSPYKTAPDNICPSLTSVTLLVNPILNRTFTIREYARLMNYPDDFIFYPETCKTPVIQCIAQGVPANFVKYIASEVKEVLNRNREFISDSADKAFCFQHYNHKLFKTFTLSDLEMMTALDSDKTFNKLEK